MNEEQTQRLRAIAESGIVGDDIRAALDQINKLTYKAAILLSVCQDAYRKHVLNDEDIGWNELGDRLQSTICEVIGDDAFCDWTEHQKGKK